MVKILRQKDKNFHKNFNILLKKRSVSDISIENTVDNDDDILKVFTVS